MSARVAFYFDVVCPYAYLAHTQIEAICERAGAELSWRPILLGGLFRAIGAGDGPMPGMPAAKAQMNLRDMHRWAEHWGVPLRMPMGHPIRTVQAMRAVLASSDVVRAARALFNAYWADGRDVSSEPVLREALAAAGFDAEAVVRQAEQPRVKEELRQATADAATAGVFGVPTFVIERPGREDELVWGQDRLLFVEKALV